MMVTIRTLATRTLLTFAAALVTLFSPGVVFAETTGETVSDPSTAPTAPAPAPVVSPGPTTPPGADGKTYKYNPTSGLWENDYYTWSPITKKTSPKNPAYHFDPATGKWSSDGWKYNAATGKYDKIEIPVPQGPPPGAVVDAPSTTSAAPAADCGCGNGNNSTATTGIDGTAAVVMVNGVSSTAISGNATVAYNTLGGDALSGNSTVVSNTLNLLQSGLSLGSGGATPTTFVANIEGNVSGDLIIDPALLAMLQPAGGTGGWANTNINTSSDTQLTNNVDLKAATGDASVIGNTKGGDATTGDANTLANVMNVANSNINAAGSFVGMINIYGNLDGDVLLPPDMLEKILSSNAPTVTLDTASLAGGNLLADITNTTDIDNNVNTFAQSGDATVAKNTSAGSATTGDSNTNVTVLNLTGHQVIGQNSLLVFVNVLGKWVGVILDAPSGTTAAALANDTATYSASGNTNVNDTNNTNITNNIDLSAATGDATVAKNTKAGDATTGNATASANILNVSNSSLSLSGWLGILFINVFGSWNGSFGVDTSAGDPPTTPAPGEGTSDPVQQNHDSVHVFSLTHDTTGNYRLGVVNNQSSTGNEDTQAMVTQTAGPTDNSGSNVLGAATANKTPHANNWGFAGAGLFISCCLVAFERMRAFRGRTAQA